MLADAARHSVVVTAEDGVRHGGAGAFIVDAMEASTESLTLGQRGPVTRTLGIPREFIAQGKADDILDSLGLNGPGIAESARAALRAVPADQRLI
jgi:1-deoxy-D-xylulose-5-phosphate synthase